MTDNTVYEFGAFRFAAETCLLRRLNNRPIKIKNQEKSVDKLGSSLGPLLRAFLSQIVENGSHEIVLPEEDLLKAVWPEPKRNKNKEIALNTLRRTINQLNQILRNNDPRERDYIERVGSGRKFNFPVASLPASEAVNLNIPPLDPELIQRVKTDYELGRQQLDTLTTEDKLKRAIWHFQQVYKIAPNFAAAYAHEAFTHMWLCILSWKAPEESVSASLRLSSLALQQDKKLGVANAARALAVLFSEPDAAKGWKEADKLLETALELDEKYYQEFEAVYQVATLMQFSRGQFREAKLAIKRALEIRPTSFISNVLRALVCFASRNYQSCHDMLQEILAEQTHIDAVYYIRVLVYIFLGKPAEARREIEQGETMAGGNILYKLLLAYWRAMWDSEDKARELLDDLDEESKRRYISPYHRALPYVYIDRQKAIERLEQAALDKDPWVLMLKVDPRVDLLRPDARFAALLHNLGLDRS